MAVIKLFMDAEGGKTKIKQSVQKWFWPFWLQNSSSKQ